MDEKVTREIFPRDSRKSYGLVELMKKSAPIVRKEPEDTVYVWPNLLMIEMICAILVTVGLMVLIQFEHAPLRSLADPSTTPNPMRAPWYFLGLQELLVYFDPWYAGVVLPGMIILGLMLFPYLDVNPKGVGYYTYSERKFAVFNYSFGFAIWWITIIIGTYLRGLDWQWYWPWSNHLEHMNPALVTLIPLHLIFVNWFHVSEGVGKLFTDIIFIGYFALGTLIPMIVWKPMYKAMGLWRYLTFMFFFLSMMGVALKIILRLLFNIKYVLVTPWINI
ncbi:MAG: cytochrome B6 [Nitrospiraceae bacterium]|nr:cytochrome B6 [Nitrospiraceae bacterium]